MNNKEYSIKNNSTNLSVEEMDALYEIQDKNRLKEAILMSDTDKFHLFTRMMRINKMMQNAKITHTKIQE